MRRSSFGPVAFILTLAVLSALWPAAADAQPRHVRGSAVVVGGYFYDPFFGPYPWYSYPYPYPYGWYSTAYEPVAELRLLVTPKDAAVYVDGYFAGIVDDFDGFFQRLRVPPGEHEIVLYRDGFRTVHERLYLTPDSTIKLRYAMEKLSPGERSEPPPAAPVTVAPPPQGVPPMPPPGRVLPPPAPPRTPSAGTAEAGTLAIRVRPADAEISIDGEVWRGSDGDARLLVQVSAGTHHVEVQKAGFRRFATDVQVRGGETTGLNVSLAAER